MQKTFSPVTPAQIVKLKAALKDHGFSAPDGDSGTISGRTLFGGATGTFSYDAHQGVLTINVTQTTGFVSAGMVFAQIQEHLA